MIKAPAPFDVQLFLKLAQRTPSDFYCFDSLPSTNATAIDYARAGKLEGTLVLSETQTQGVGRKGNSWFSPPYVNLYFSLLLRPTPPRLHYVPFLAGLALSNTLSGIGLSSDLKWPNDVLVSGKKIAGFMIVTSFEENRLQYAILGSGINVNLREFPEKLREVATSVVIEKGIEVPREHLLASFVFEFENLYEKIDAMSWEDLCSMLRARSSFIDGCPVSIEHDGGTTAGITAGLDPYGGLILVNEAGRRVFYAGEIQQCRRR